MAIIERPTETPALAPVGAPAVALVPSGLDPLALIQAEHEQYTRPLSGALTAEDVDDETDE